MNAAILTQPDVPIYEFMIAAAIFTCLLMFVLLVLLAKGQAMHDAVLRWCRRTFTDPTPQFVQAEVISRGREFDTPKVVEFNVAAERRRLHALMLASASRKVVH